MFRRALLIMLAAEGASLLAFRGPAAALPLLIIIGAATFWLAVKNPAWGIYVLFGELFIGSRGHLLEYGFLSLRLVVFTAVFLAWVIGQIQNAKIKMQNDNVKLKIYWVLLVVIGFGIIRGLMAGHGLANVFFDANGYLYLLILPAVLAGVRDKETQDNIFEILAAAIVIIAAKGLLLFVWFTFGLPEVATVYHWVVNLDIGEITGQVGTASRIFMQSQFWALMGMFIWGVREIRGIRGRIVLTAAVFSVVLSLSRSFWLGAVAGGIFVGAIALYQGYRGDWGYMGNMVKRGSAVILLAVASLGLLWGFGRLSGGVSESVASRGINPAAEAAGGARLLLLPELLSAIKEDPVFGAGFGKEVVYKSYLPDRVTPQNPDGEITTYASEWGYLDTAIKIGMLGLVVYLLFVAKIFGMGLAAVKITNHKSQITNLGILGGLVALVVLNVTTPYLNHPLGIGYLILSLAVFRNFEF